MTSKSTSSSSKTAKEKRIPRQEQLDIRLRFYRHHKSWIGHEQWKTQGHARETEVELTEDDLSSAWRDCLRLGIPWGGRAAGGRGVKRVTGDVKDIRVEQVGVVLGGVTLLNSATLILNEGHKYGLVGRNGTGKSTLLQRIAMGSLPGFPPWKRTLLVEQEVHGTDDTPLECVLRADYERERLLAEEEELLADPDDDSVERAQRLDEIYTRLDELDSDSAAERAMETLKELKFSDKRANTPTRLLSGGWRMRAALACAVFTKPDVLLLDEPSNHLDLQAVLWLQEFLCEYEGTVLLVSHDRNFLNAVCTDIAILKDQQLHYHAGTYDDYLEQTEVKHRNAQSQLDAQARQKKHMQQYVDTQRRQANSKRGDQKKQRQINSRVVRMERMGAKREDGKKWKLSYHDLRQQVHLEVPDRERFKFPPCDTLDASPILQLRDAAFQFADAAKPVFSGVSATISQASRIAIVGKNAAGKTTLVRLLCGDLDPTTGESFRHARLRLGYFSQHSIETLDPSVSATTLFEREFAGAKPLEIRSHLGMFGLHGATATREIGTLSGGQKTRIALARIYWAQPHILVLDEPTNHLDMVSIQALSDAVQGFNGGVIIVSHNQGFLTQTCDELWILRKGTLTMRHKDDYDDGFAGAFSSYCEELLG